MISRFQIKVRLPMADSLRSYLRLRVLRTDSIPFSQAAFRIIRFTDQNDLAISCFQVKMERSIFRFSTTNFP
jgi:hypothetical protein